VSHRNCPGSKCPGFSSITALVSKCLVPTFLGFLVSKCVEIGAEVSQSVLMSKCLVAEVSGNTLYARTRILQTRELSRIHPIRFVIRMQFRI